MAVNRHGHTVVHAAHIAGYHNIGPVCIDLKNRVAGIGIFVDHMLDRAFQLHQLLFVLLHPCPPFPQNRRTFTDKDIIPHTGTFGKPKIGGTDVKCLAGLQIHPRLPCVQKKRPAPLAVRGAA